MSEKTGRFLCTLMIVLTIANVLSILFGFVVLRAVAQAIGAMP